MAWWTILLVVLGTLAFVFLAGNAYMRWAYRWKGYDG